MTEEEKISVIKLIVRSSNTSRDLLDHSKALLGKDSQLYIKLDKLNNDIKSIRQIIQFGDMY